MRLIWILPVAPLLAVSNPRKSTQAETRPSLQPAEYQFMNLEEGFSLTAEEVLDGKLATTDKRYGTFKLALDIIRAKKLTNLIELGTARNGDRACHLEGCSTMILSKWAEMTPGMRLFSVDNSPKSLKAASEALYPRASTILILSDSVKFLKEFKDPIDFLYLDSQDFSPSSPFQAQEQALRETIVAYTNFHDDSLVLVDDCDADTGGRCALVEVFLKEHGWRTILKTYQLLMAAPNPVIL